MRSWMRCARRSGRITVFSGWYSVPKIQQQVPPSQTTPTWLVAVAARDQVSNESSTNLDTDSNDSTQSGGSVELENLLDRLLSNNS